MTPSARSALRAQRRPQMTKAERAAHRALDLTGQRYGKLVVETRAPDKRNRRGPAWFCRCDCGTQSHVSTTQLITGETKSCGCSRYDPRPITAKLRHGHSRRGRKTATYRCWRNMILRCTNPKVREWPLYGGRGITICDRWRNSFDNFLADMGEKPTGLTIDRINNDGNYEPGNCRWATYSEQLRNRRPRSQWPSTIAKARAIRAGLYRDDSTQRKVK